MAVHLAVAKWPSQQKEALAKAEQRHYTKKPLSQTEVAPLTKHREIHSHVEELTQLLEEEGPKAYKLKL